MRELRTCDAFVALLTREYVQSEHCRMEIFIARSRGCPVLPIALDDCFDLLDQYQETKGLADTFMVRLYRLSLVGLPITRDEAIARVIAAVRSIGQEPARKAVYVAYCNSEAGFATGIVRRLEAGGVPAWIATQDCRVGDDWRQAQARGVLGASAQVIVMDDTIVDAEVLRTEIMLAEAIGLPVFPVLGSTLHGDDSRITHVMNQLGKADLTYRRLTEVQPFGCDDRSIERLVKGLRPRMVRAGRRSVSTP